MYNALLNNKIAQNNTLYKYSMLSCKFMNKRIYNLYEEYRCTPTFVNLKSNTMKNTLQRYGLLGH